jgi:hypothetical protein
MTVGPAAKLSSKTHTLVERRVLCPRNLLGFEPRRWRRADVSVQREHGDRIA